MTKELSLVNCCVPVIAVALIVSACSDADESKHDDAASDPHVQQVLALTGDATRGEPLFKATCAKGDCHGATGDSGPGTSLTQAVPEHDDPALVQTIIYGEGTMPKVKELSDQDISDVVAYCRVIFPHPEGHVHTH